jgi:predicted alpha/beta hydrolase family esterase
VGDVLMHLAAGGHKTTPKELGIPTVTVAAELDGIVKRDISEAVSQFWSNELMVVEGLGHCFGDEGWENIVPVKLAQWLDANV